MNTILGFVLLIASLISLFSLKRQYERLQIFKKVSLENSSALSKLESKLEERKVSFWQNIVLSISLSFKSNYNILINNLPSKLHLIIIIIIGVICGLTANYLYLQLDSYLVIAASIIITLFGLLFILKRKVKKQFYNDFPEALNLMIGVISSGSSISVAFSECALRSAGPVGKTMKEISTRIDLGDNPHNVLLNSYRLLPFPEYYFFILTIMVNLDGGGELKDVLAKLNKMISNNAMLAKTRDGKTAELRMTMLILSCMPPGFVFLLKFISEENYRYLLDTDGGHIILYYVFASELIGILLIKKMVSKVA